MPCGFRLVLGTFFGIIGRPSSTASVTSRGSIARFGAMRTLPGRSHGLAASQNAGDFELVGPRKPGFNAVGCPKTAALDAME